MFPGPLNVVAWCEEHARDVAHAEGHACVYKDAWYMILIVAGPNKRVDFHVNATPEIFYQVRGTMTLRRRGATDVVLGPGELFVLPPHVPHQPVRPTGSVGLVIEHVRKPREEDGFTWYCARCGRKTHEVRVHVSDLGLLTDLLRSPRPCEVCGPVSSL